MKSKQRLVAYLEQQGIRFVHHRLKTDYLSAIEEHELAEAPFTGGLAVDWTEATIHVDDTWGEPAWAHLLHEAGHLLWEEELNPDHWNDSDFLGWEFSVVKHLKLPMCEFYRANESYAISFTDPVTDRFYDEMDEVPLYSRAWRRLVKHYVEDGIQNGYITEDGLPNHSTIVD